MVTNVREQLKPGTPALRKEFPILDQKIGKYPLVYFDNAATTQKPRAVIEYISHYYTHNNANIHRGIHTLSERATEHYESVRTKVKDFINARETKEIVFCKGTTEAINLVAQSYLAPRIQAGDEILLTEMEHHSNIVPWQMLCKSKGAVIKVIPLKDNGELDLSQFHELLNKKTKILSLTHVSNALGTINPIKEIIAMAHEKGVPVLIDGAQSAPHLTIDVKNWNCDFYAFSSHKMYGPTGVGVLYGKSELLEEMPPYQGGGEMIQYVTFEETQYNVLPYKFEAGTQPISSVIGLGAAIDFLHAIGLEAIHEHEMQLLRYLTHQIQSIKGINIIGTSENKSSILTFTMDNVHAHDIGTILNEFGIAIRSGHHCAMPVMNYFKVAATARVSMGMYNTLEDVDVLLQGLDKIKAVFSL